MVKLHIYQYDFVGKGLLFQSVYDDKKVAKDGIEFQIANIHPEDGPYLISVRQRDYLLHQKIIKQ